MLDVGFGDVAIHDGIKSQAGNTFDAEFGSYVFAVGENGVETDGQYVGYLFVYISHGNKTQYIDFALC